MSPKKQPTAAKRARRGEKFTTARREAANPAENLAPEMILAGLTDLARAGRRILVRVVEPENPQPYPDFADRVWGVVEAAVDGYVVHQLGWGGNLRGADRDHRRPRVPVPHRTADGDIAVLELPPLVWTDPRLWPRQRWVFAHNGWALDIPGRIADGEFSLTPSMELPYEVREFRSGSSNPDEVLGEDYIGGPASWGASSWCADEDDARELACAMVSFDGGPLRVQVWEHDRFSLNDLPILIYERDADSDRAPLPYRPFGAPVTGRPSAPGADFTAEPVWNPAVEDNARPKYALHVWTGTAWRTHSWHQGRNWSSAAAAYLRIGVDGGRYAFGYVSGPHYPNAWNHDWTQIGRSCSDLVPDHSSTEALDRDHMARVLG